VGPKGQREATAPRRAGLSRPRLPLYKAVRAEETGKRGPIPGDIPIPSRKRPNLATKSVFSLLLFEKDLMG
jgi:hypothetical protein